MVKTILQKISLKGECLEKKFDKVKTQYVQIASTAQ